MRSAMNDALHGFGVSRGVASGPVARMAPRPDLSERPDPDHTNDVRTTRAANALEAVASALEARSRNADAEAAAVLEAQALMARDPALATAISSAVESGSSAQNAIALAFSTFRSALEAAGPYMAERVADLDDVRDRALAELLGLPMPGIPQPGHPFVLVATDLSPADTALLDPQQVLAIITEQGGPSSHTAILAKSLAIPAVVAVATADALTDNEIVLVDGGAGSIERSPNPETVRAALDRYRLAAERSSLATGPGRTADGTPVRLLLNIGAERDLEVAAAADAEGVGLFRTEFLFLDRPSAPSVEEQIGCYRKIFDAFAGRRVVVRTLDAGADKPLGFVQHGDEPNPALGVRGLRTTRFAPQLLSDQLAAIAAAAAQSSADVWVMAPMVSVPSEAQEFADSARAHGVRVVGSMIEVPAAALRARHILAECDFVSLGTNDLAQYTFAADRMLGELGDLLDPWQPGLLELVRTTAEAGRSVGKPVGVCGEAASDPDLALVLVGLGVSSLSMAPSAIPAVRTSLLEHTIDECRSMAEAVLRAPDGRSARTVLKERQEAK